MSSALPIEIDCATLRHYQTEGIDHIVLDVREPAETAAIAFEGALEIPMGEVPQNLDKLPDEKPIIVLCRIGGRSMQVTGWMRQQGYENVTNLRGGIEDWLRTS